jgi:extracellular factor (EF) 3-hydroxypalmitic acid methyl ester biosynthesis protein
MLDTGVETHYLTDPYAIDPTLDQLADALESIDTIPAIWPRLLAVMEHLRRAAGGDKTWHHRVRAHRITQLLHEEPATAWSFRKPRGYSGDAHLIDYLYEHPVAAALSRATPRGHAIGAMVLASTAPVAVQERRRLLARLLDATADRVPGAEALVLACGHFRESELARSLHTMRRIVALDQDSASIAEMQRCLRPGVPVMPVEASIGRMIVRPLVHGTFDLVYAAGLYDYLDSMTAARLTQGMFTALKPGGRLLFANFCPGVIDYGYMDAFMDWRLILRDETEMQALVDTLPQDELARSIIFRGMNQAVVYALVQKR